MEEYERYVMVKSNDKIHQNEILEPTVKVEKNNYPDEHSELSVLFPIEDLSAILMISATPLRQTLKDTCDLIKYS